MSRRRRHIEYWERDYMSPPDHTQQQPERSFLAAIGAVYVVISVVLAFAFLLIR